MRFINWLIIGFMLLSSWSTAYVYQSTYVVSGILDSKTNDEFAQDSVNGSGDQVCTRTLESDYGFSKLFSRYILRNSDSRSNGYSMSLNANGMTHSTIFSGDNISSSNLAKFDDNTGVATYFNVIANGTMTESLKLRTDGPLNNNLVASKVAGMFDFKSSFTEVKTPEYDTLRLSSELAKIDLNSILKGIPESGDSDLNVTKMQSKLKNDLETTTRTDISPSGISADDFEGIRGTANNTTESQPPKFDGLNVENTSAYYQLKKDNVFVHSVLPDFKLTREDPVKLGRYPV